MNSDNPQAYDPADDDNQGVAQLLAQADESSNGVSQVEYMNPVTAQGPEPEKEEVNDSDTSDNGVSADLLGEEAVENGNVTVDNDNDE